MGALFGKISVETPAHTVVHATPAYEVWRYEASVSATVRASSLAVDGVAPSGDAFQSQAFRTLARYIGVFGRAENAAAGAPEAIAMTAPVVLAPPAPEPVAMTAPVVVEGGAAPSTSGRRMTFLLPSKYKSVAEAPAPTNPAVELGVAPAGRCEAVATYPGNLDMDAAPEKAAQLLDALEKDAVQVTGEYTVCGYNPPFTLPWFKRNEIHVPVDPDSIAELCPPPESEGVAA